MRKLIADVVAGVMALENHELLHTHVLAFGLAFRNITNAIEARKSLSPTYETSFAQFSVLDEDDLEFVHEQLKGLLRWANHPSYPSSQKRKGKVAGKAAGTGPSKRTRSAVGK